MNTSSTNAPTSNKKLIGNQEAFKDKKGKEHVPKYKKPHVIIPVEDMNWALSQKPSVSKLWQECWIADGFGSRWMQLNTSLKRSAFMEAKKALENRGLFIFKTEKSIRDNRETICWMVKNLHGARVNEYWDSESTNLNDALVENNVTSIDIDTTSEKKESIFMDSTTNTTSIDMDTTSMKMDTTSIDMDTTSAYADSIYTQSLTQQSFPDPSVTPHKHLSNSSKELLRCEENISASSRENEISGECPGMPLNLGEMSTTPFLDDQELLRWLKAAENGTQPPQEVIDQLRESGKYWVEFVAFSRKHKWDLRASSTSVTPVSSILEQLRQAQKSRKGNA